MTADPIPDTGSMWRCDANKSDITITKVAHSPFGPDEMDVYFQMDRGQLGVSRTCCPLDAWRKWLMSGLILPVKEESDAA